MTENDAVLLYAITATLWTSQVVLSVALYSKLVSRFTGLQKWARSQLMTPPSDAKLNELLADQVALSSALASVGKTVKRLSSRSGMEELRAERKSAAPPPGASKEEVRKYYGLNGLTSAEIARRAQSGINSSED